MAEDDDKGAAGRQRCLAAGALPSRDRPPATVGRHPFKYNPGGQLFPLGKGPQTGGVVELSHGQIFAPGSKFVRNDAQTPTSRAARQHGLEGRRLPPSLPLQRLRLSDDRGRPVPLNGRVARLNDDAPEGHLLREQGVGSSNLPAPTNQIKKLAVERKHREPVWGPDLCSGAGD